MALKVDWIYGYHGKQCRNNVQYLGSGNDEIVYFVAKVGIALNIYKHKQRWYFGHSREIICLAQNVSKGVVGTGQMGPNAYACVWDPRSMQTLSTLHRGHGDGISAMDFTVDGERLATTGTGNKSEIVVWDWQNGSIVARTNEVTQVVFIKFSPFKNSDFVTCGLKHVKFWKHLGNDLERQLGNYSGKGVHQTMLCAAYGFKDDVYTGSLTGDVYIWRRGKLEGIFQNVHKGGVISMHRASDMTYATGGRNADICLWDESFNLMAKVHLGYLLDGCQDVAIRSVHSHNKDQLIVGTDNHRIVEIRDGRSIPRAICLVNGPTGVMLNVLTTHPYRPLFVTGSSDGVLRLWELTKMQSLYQAVVGKGEKGELICCEFNPDGRHLAIALKIWTIVIMNATNLSIKMTIKNDSTAPVALLKHSPNGAYLVAACDDGEILLYDIFRSYAVSGRWCAGSGNPPKSIDWSTDSRHIRVNDVTGARYVFSIPDGTHMCNSIEGFVWSSFASQIAASESDVTAADVDLERGIVVACSSRGSVSLLPLAPRASVRRTFRSPHSSTISAVQFTYNKAHVISIGKSDYTIVQWKVVDKCEEDFMKVDFEEQSSDEEADSEDKAVQLDSEVEAELLATYEGRQYRKEEILERNRLDVSTVDDRQGKGQRNAPSRGLQLKYVFGYRGLGCRDNVYFIDDRSIVFHVAAVAILLDLDTNRQRHYLCHTDDILCLAVHPNKDYVATGEVSNNSSIHVWSHRTMKTVSLLKSRQRSSIRALDFTCNGKLIVGIGYDEATFVLVWNWKSGQEMARSWAISSRLLSVKCDPWDTTKFATVGIQQLRFWKTTGNGLLYKTMKFGSDNTKVETMTSVAYVKSNHTCITGASSGYVYIWLDYALSRTIKCHSGPIFTLQAFDKGILTAGKDGNIQFWNESMDQCLKVMCLPPSERPAVIKAAHVAHGKTIVGMNTNEIILLDESQRTRVVVQGHSGDSLHSLSSHPKKNRFATLGKDSSLKIWDLDTFQLISCKNLHRPNVQVAYSSNGSSLFVGSIDGNISMLCEETLDVVHEWHHRSLSVSVMKCSPEDALLAVGYHDIVDVFHIDMRTWISVCYTAPKSVALIKQLDWSVNGNSIHVNTLNNDSFIFDAWSGSQSNLIADQVKWASWSSNRSLRCENIWALSRDHVIDISRSPDETLLAIGDAYGFVRLVECPVLIKYPKCKWYLGHGGHVSFVRWNCDGRKLISCNGEDTAVLVWNLSDENRERKADYDSDESDSDDAEDGFYVQIADGVGLDGLGKQRPDTEKDCFLQKSSLQSEVHFRGTDKLHQDLRVSKLVLHHVFGYSGHGHLCNAHYVGVDSMDIVYPSSSVGIVVNTLTNTQRFYFGHTDTITCVVVNEHPNYAGIVATGQQSGNPAVNIWSTTDLCARSRLNVSDDRGIVAIAFSVVGGNLLASIGSDPDHTVSIWNWLSGRQIATKRVGSTRAIYSVKFRPDDDSRFVTVGHRHVAFWTICGAGLIANKAYASHHPAANIPAKSMLSVTFGKGDITYTGDIYGNICIWKEHFLQKIVVKAHTGPIYAMHLSLFDGLITTGSRENYGAHLEDGGIKVWDSGVQRCRPFLVGNFRCNVYVTSVCRSKGRILIGSSANVVYEVTERTAFVRQIHCAHGSKGVWGLAAHGRYPLVASTGGDRALRMWDLHKRCLKNCLQLSSAGRSVHFSPAHNDILVVGQECGKFLIVNSFTMKIYSKTMQLEQAITTVKISPCGNHLAVVDANNRVTMYCITRACDPVQLGKYHGAASMHKLLVDYTIDGTHLLVVNGCERVVLSVPDCYLLQNIADIPPSVSNFPKPPLFETFDARLMWSTAVSTKRDMVVSGNKLGDIRLFHIRQNDVLDLEHRFHVPSHEISAIAFSQDDEYLLTAGGHDCRSES